MGVRPRSLQSDDLARAQELFCFDFYENKHQFLLLRSPAGIGIIVSAALALDWFLVPQDGSRVATTLVAMGLHLLASLAGGGGCVAILLCYQRVRAWKFIRDSLSQLTNALNEHCSGVDSDFSPGLGTSCRCWVVEHIPDDSKRGHGSGIIIGLIVVKISSVKHNRRWLRKRCFENNCAVSSTKGDFNSGLAHVDWLVVRKDHRRQGVASALLRAAEDHCRGLEDDRGKPVYRYLRLAVGSSWADAILFYMRLGYTEESCSSSSLFSERMFYLRKALQHQE